MNKFLANAATKDAVCHALPDRKVPPTVTYFLMESFTDFMRDADPEKGGAEHFAITSEIVRDEQEEYEDWEEEFLAKKEWEGMTPEAREEAAAGFEQAKQAKLEA